MPLRDAMLFYILKYLSRKIFVRKKVRKTTFLRCTRWSYHRRDRYSNQKVFASNRKQWKKEKLKDKKKKKNAESIVRILRKFKGTRTFSSEHDPSMLESICEKRDIWSRCVRDDDSAPVRLIHVASRVDFCWAANYYAALTDAWLTLVDYRNLTNRSNK